MIFLLHMTRNYSSCRRNRARSANLRQHVQEWTHRHGHILDLVIFRDDDNLIKGVCVSSMLSDHSLVNINVSLQSVSTKVISYSKYKSIDQDAFLANLRVFSLVLDPLDDVDHLVNLYNNTLRDIVDEHAPLRTKELPRRLMLAWYNKNIQTPKRHRRYCEKLWIRSSLCVHFEMFKVSKILVKNTLASAKSEYYNKRSKHQREIKGLFPYRE